MTAILSYATIIEEVLEQLERGAENVSEAFEQIQYDELIGSQAVEAIQQYVEQFPGREALTTMEVLEEVEYMVGRFGNDGFDITNIELVATVIREKMVTELRNHVFEYGERDMTLLTKQVEVKWHGSNRKHYTDLGYKFTRIGDTFTVGVEHLSSGSGVRVSVQCDYCEEKYSTTWQNFLKSRRRAGELEKDTCGNYTCRAMKKAEIRQGYYTTVADVPELYEEWYDEEDPSRVLTGSHTKYQWRCVECGGEWKSTVYNRTLGNGCPHCANYFRYSEPLNNTHPELVEEWSSKNELSPDKVTAGSEKRIIWECSTCSKTWKAMVSHRTSLGNGCPSCNESKGEKLVAKILDDLNVSYSREQTFPNLKGSGGRSLRYDFAILHEGEPIALIEYDGIQHFRAVEHFGGEARLKRQQRHDRLKDVYAQSNSIPLLRINYKHTEAQTSSLVKQFVKEVVPCDEARLTEVG